MKARGQPIKPPWFFDVPKPVMWYCNTIMTTGNVGVIFQVPERKRELMRDYFGRLDVVPHGGDPPDYVVIFVRHNSSSWHFVSQQKYNPTSSSQNCPDGIIGGRWHCAVWGRKRPSVRQVIQYFSNMWMIYDRSGLFKYTIARGWCAAISSSPVSAAG